MRPRYAIPSVMKKAEALFHTEKANNLPDSLLRQYHTTGAVASHLPDATWQDQLPTGAVIKDYRLVSFLAYRPMSEQPIIVAEVVVSMWQDDPFTIVKWHPDA